MRFLMEAGFDVKQGETRRFQEWLQANEERLAEHAPEGWEYLGTYAAIFSSEKEAGDYRQLFRLDSYAAMDTFAEVMKEEEGEFARLVHEMTREFLDQEKGARWSSTLMKAVTDAAIWGES